MTLNSDGGALPCIPYGPSQFYTHPRITFWAASESFSDQWKQNKALIAILDISPFCLYLINPPGIPFLWPPFFLNAELRRWGD